MSKVKNWLLATRPKTLTAAVVPIISTAALLVAEGHVLKAWVFWYALVACFLIQIGTNFVNDAADFKKGADTHERLGPMRVTHAGHFTYKQVMIVASLCFLGALLFGIPLVREGGMVIVVIGLLSILFGYAYTSGPFPLAYLGLGDLFVLIFFGFVATHGLVYLNSAMMLESAWILALQTGLLCTVLIAVNNLRDINQDVKVNKKTLAVRLGPKKAKFEIYFLIWFPYLLLSFWVMKQNYWAAALPLISLPLAIKLTQNIRKTEPSTLYNKFLGMSAGLHLSFSICLSLGLWLK